MIERKEKGDRLRAREVNEIADRLDNLERPFGTRGSPWRLSGGAAVAADATNDGEFDLPAFSPAIITGHAFSTGAGIRNKVLLNVDTPAAGYEGKWVVTAEPIVAGQAGKVWVTGIFPVRIYNDGDMPDRVDITDGETYVVPASGGPAEVIFEEDVTGDVHIAVVRWIGVGASSGGLYNCRCATTANHGLSGLSAVDGVTPVADDLILVWKQSTASQNGVYSAASSGWTKVADFTDYVAASVALGTLYGKLMFVSTADNTVAPMGAVLL